MTAVTELLQTSAIAIDRFIVPSMAGAGTARYSAVVAQSGHLQNISDDYEYNSTHTSRCAGSE